MRIYAVADIHAKIEHLETICLVSARLKPDLIVIAGDLTHYFNWESAIARLDQLGTPIACIRGNSDFRRIEQSLAKAQNLQLLGRSPHYFNGMAFVGTNGTIPLPFASRICIREKQMLDNLLPLNKESILVAHPPPRGICDRVGRFSAGSQNLFDFINTTQPKMLLCGHIHEQAGQGFIKNTLVVNCAVNTIRAGAVIDLEKGTPPRVNFLQANARNAMETH
jgi:uncharacterized protein